MNSKSLPKLLILFFFSLSLLNCTGESGRREDLSILSGPVPGVATHIKIEDEAGGTGKEITTKILKNGAAIRLYAVSRDFFGDFVEDTPVNWSSSVIDGYFSNLTGTTSKFTPTGDEEGLTITASHMTLESDITGILDVTYDVESFEGLSLWLRADSFLGKLSNTDNVINWYDVNGSARSLTTIAAGQEPSFHTNIINGHPVIRFDSSNSEGLQSLFPVSDLITDTEYTYFIVFNAKTINTNEEIPSQNNALLVDNNGNFGATLSSDGPLIQTFNFDGTDANKVTKNIAITNTFLFTSYHDSDNLYAQLNGDTPLSIASSNTDDLTAQLTVGGGHPPAGFYNGDIAEIIIYNNSLLDADRIIVKDYLCTKYNIICQ